MTETTGSTSSDARNEGQTLTIRLNAADTDLCEPAAVARQIPPASTLAPGTRVVVLATATRERGVLRRLLGPRSVPVPRSAVCTALLVHGYVEIGASDEGGWGTAPST
jgi:hypothetical protein